MIRLRFLSLLAVAAVAALASGSATAGWGSRHGHGASGGGSYGSYSSHGGSSGYAAHSSYAAYSSYGSSGGASYASSGGGASHGGSTGRVGLLHRLAARIHAHRAARHARHSARHASSGGSTGYVSSYGSTGYGSTGGYGSYGSYARSGGSAGYGAASYGYGSSGAASYGSSGSYQAYPSYQPGVIIDGGGYAPGTVIQGDAIEGGEVQRGDAGSDNPPPPPAEARIGDDAALLTVSVPESARVLVNGNPTVSQGPIRQFMSRGLQEGYSYTYVVEVETTVDGRPVTDRKTVRLRAGDTERLVFDIPEPLSDSIETALTLQVPADAQVTLAGNPTSMTGATRIFRTHQLAAGQSWEDYTIEVAVVRDGRRLAQEKTIRLEAGAQQQLAFDFDQDQVALASR